MTNLSEIHRKVKDGGVLAKSRTLNFSIATSAELLNLMQSVDTEVLNGNYILKNDIDMTGYISETIGKDILQAFTGSFDGKGYTISINQTVSSNFGGLFGIIRGSVVNLNVNYLKNSSNDNIKATITGCNIDDVLISGGFVCGNYGAVENCNVVYNGGVNIEGEYCGSFSGFSASLLGSNGQIQNCSVLCNKSISISASNYVGGFCATLEEGEINNCSFNVLGTASFVIDTEVDSNEAAGFCAFLNNSSSINNCSLNIYYATTITSYTNTGSLIGNLSDSSTVNTLVAFFAKEVTINSNTNAGSVGYINTNSTVENVNVSYKSGVNMNGTNIGGLVGYTNGSSISLSNIICSGLVSLGTVDSDYTGGLIGYKNNGSVENCAAIYFNTINFNGSNMAGICSYQRGTFDRTVAVYYTNNWDSIGTTNPFFNNDSGAGAYCFSTSYDSASQVISPEAPEFTTITLNLNSKTVWLNNLISLHHQIQPVNDSANISSILAIDGVSTLAKNNAILISFGNYSGYVMVQSSVIKPLLVKSIPTLPSTIKYMLIEQGIYPPSILPYQFGISSGGLGYIGQPIADLGDSVIGISDTNCNCSVFFNDKQVPVGGKYTASKFSYTVNGVGSSLLQITPIYKTNPASSSDAAAIALLIIGIILLIIAIYIYVKSSSVAWTLFTGLVGLILIIVSIVLFV